MERGLMAGQALTRGFTRRLDAYGEERIFDLYIKHKSVRRLLKNMPEEVGNMSNAPFYKWLKADPERRKKWEICKLVIASTLAEETLLIADATEDGSIESARLRIQTRQWIASRYDRATFGRNPTVKAGASDQKVIGATFLQALKETEEGRLEKRAEAYRERRKAEAETKEKEIVVEAEEVPEKQNKPEPVSPPKPPVQHPTEDLTSPYRKRKGRLSRSSRQLKAWE